MRRRPRGDADLAHGPAKLGLKRAEHAHDKTVTEARPKFTAFVAAESVGHNAGGSPALRRRDAGETR
jgi:hypothetical protein